MRVLLVNTNRNRSMSPPPVGLAFVSKGLKEAGHEVALCDLMFARHPESALERAIATFQPEVAGFTIRNLDNQDMSNTEQPLPSIRQYVTIARSQDIVTVLGGTAFSTFPERMLEYMGADYGIVGQGEDSMVRLLQSLLQGAVDITIPGLVFREGPTVYANPPVFPGYRQRCADWSVFDLRGYRHRIMPASVMHKSGCPYQCSYCDAHVTFGKQFNFRDTDSIIEDIDSMRRCHRVATFYLVDPCFNSPIDQAKQTLEALIRANLGVQLSTVFSPIAGQYDDELFHLFRRAGGALAIVGTESFSDTMLRSYKKTFDAQDVYEFCRIADKHRIPLGLDAMFGGPDETEATLRESFELLDRTPYAFLIASVGVRVVPRTTLFERARADGFVDDPEALMFPKFYFSPHLDVTKTRGLVKRVIGSRPWRGLRMARYGINNFLARYLDCVA